MEIDKKHYPVLAACFAQYPYEQWKEILRSNRKDLPLSEELKQADPYHLLVLLMDHSFQIFTDGLSPLLAGDATPLEKLRQLSLAYIALACEQHDAFRIAFLIRPSKEEQEHLPVEHAIRFRVMVRRLFRELFQQEGADEPSIELHVQSFMCVLVGVVTSYLHLHRMDLIELQQLSEHIIRLYLTGLEANLRRIY